MTVDKKQKRVLFLISAALVIATLAAYEPIRHNSFVNFDDNRYITENPDIKYGITLRSFVRAFKPHYLMFTWHPLTTLTNMLNCEFFGLNPFGHHLISIMFHIANVLLVFLILNRITGSTWASGFAAAVFALHPLQVESVAWASELKTVMSGLFWFITIAVYICYAKRPSIGLYISVLAAYGLCIMTKPTVVTLPFVLLLLDYWPLERVRKQKTEDKKRNTETSLQKKPVGWLIIEKIPLLAMSVFLCVMTIIAQKSGLIIATLESWPLNCRISNMFLSYIRYLGKTIWPSGLAVIYPTLDPAFLRSTGTVWGLLFVLISAVFIYFGLHRKYLVMGWLWYVGTMVPMIGLVQSGSQAMANRYMYISILGLLIIAAWSIKDLIADRPRLKIIAFVSGGILIVLAACLTRKQVRHWENDITLFGYATKVTEDNSRAETNFGIALAAAGRLDEAKMHLNNAIRKNPANSEAIYNLGIALAITGKYDDAIKCLASVIELDPKYPDINKRMGTALLAAGRPREAIENLQKSLEINPGEAVVYISISIAYIKLGEYTRAIENWTRAKELQPNGVEGYNNPAWLLVTAGEVTIEDAKNAIEFAERACEMTGNKDAGMLDTLAAAYAAAGKFPEAVSTAEKAVSIAKDAGREETAEAIGKRVELYKAGQRYVQK